MDNDQAPPTKGDIRALKSDVEALGVEIKTDLRAEFKAEFAAFDQRLEGRLDVREQRILDTVGGMIHDSETKLLQAFYSYAEGNNRRLNQVDGNSAIFLNRLGIVEERLLQVEKRLNFPPTA